jgi:hypothetical protein
MPESERGDTRAANWGKRVKKWKRWAGEMCADAGATVTFPDDFETPPHRRCTCKEVERGPGFVKHVINDCPVHDIYPD